MKKIDYRTPENRQEYFNRLYTMNLEYGVMPGLVYLYMPKLAEHFGWNDDQILWFAFINGNTQNPITSLNIVQQVPLPTEDPMRMAGFTDWFNDNWESLQFDTDRRYQKKELPKAMSVYAGLVREAGSQKKLLTGTFSELWKLVTTRFHGFGRLGSFSYLEYVYLNGFGADCDNLLFTDRSGSKSHRNGALFYAGLDHLVDDKRAANGFDGTYPEFGKMCKWLDGQAYDYLEAFKKDHDYEYAGNFTLESQYCQFKNGFFGRRYPGVYSDMAWERIVWADARGLGHLTGVFKDIRAAHLPVWLRQECEPTPVSPALKKSQFMQTGFPYRGEYL